MASFGYWSSGTGTGGSLTMVQNISVSIIEQQKISAEIKFLDKISVSVVLSDTINAEVE